MKQTTIHSESCAAPVRQFRTGVSLHSHTFHSRETLDFIYRLAERIPCIRWVLKHGEARYCAQNATKLDLGRAWWTPPCAPYDSWLLERNQIECRFQSNALVSLTDHDSIEAPLSLRTLESCSQVPVSVEWTIPCEDTFFHLGVHNLPADTAPQVFRQLQDLTAGHEGSELTDALDRLSRNPETLIVFNHPCWDESGVGAQRHAEIAMQFLRCNNASIHALELNGLRPWAENQRVLQMARAVGKPIVSGGDRHALEANTILDLSNAETFSEYVEQVRSGWTDVLVTKQYREPFALRILRSLEEVLQDYDEHGRGWRSWSDRVFYHCDDGLVRSLSELFTNGVPGPIQFFVNGVGLIRHCGVQRTVRSVMAPQQELAL